MTTAWSQELAPISFYKKSFVENAELNIGYFVTCRFGSGAFCQNLCEADTCLVNTDSCDGCVTSRNLNVFALFNDFAKVFTLSQSPVDWASVFNYFAAGELKLVDENAILNLFEDTQSEEKYANARQRFLNSCPADTSKAFLVINRDFMPLYYICQGSYGQQIYNTHWSAEYSR